MSRRLAAVAGSSQRRLRDLLIQREAQGWRNHSDVKRAYVIPPALPSE